MSYSGALIGSVPTFSTRSTVFDAGNFSQEVIVEDSTQLPINAHPDLGNSPRSLPKRAPLLPFSVTLGPSEAMNGMLLSLGVVALLVVAFTRGRLGYQHYRQEEEEEPVTATAPT